MSLFQLGMHDIFSAASDLTGIAATPPLYVSDVMQKATIEVDERGATAAAATSRKLSLLYFTRACSNLIRLIKNEVHWHLPN